MTQTTLTMQIPGREPVTGTLDQFQAAVETITGKAGGKIYDKRQMNLDVASEDGDRVVGERIKAVIDRIERLEEEKAGIASDIREVFAEAKGNGFDTKALKKIISLRKRDYAERQEEEAILELYMQAIGMA